MPKTVTVLHDDYIRLQEDLAKALAELSEVKQDLAHAEGMLEFERNKYEKILQAQGSALAKKLKQDISLEVLALRDMTEGLSDLNNRRFTRRLNRIDEYLDEFGVKE